MDLAKAKNIIIALLIAFNVFLLYNNFSYSRGQGVQKDTITNAADILKKRGVVLECNIPKNAGSASWLEYGNGKLDKQAIALELLGDTFVASGEVSNYEIDGKKLRFLSDSEFEFTDSNPSIGFNLKDSERIEKFIREYLKDKNLLKGNYVVDNLVRNQDGSTSITFIEEYKGFLIYDNYCTVAVTGSGISMIRYGKLQLIGFSSRTDEDMAAAYQILLANFMGEGAGSRVITKIDIGYKFEADETMNGMESTELLPVWRVIIKDSGPKYFSTFNASAF